MVEMKWNVQTAFCPRAPWEGRLSVKTESAQEVDAHRSRIDQWHYWCWHQPSWGQKEVMVHRKVDAGALLPQAVKDNKDDLITRDNQLTYIYDG